MNSNEAIQSAVGHLKNGNLSEAENMFRLVLEAQSDNVTALHLLGVIYYRLKQYKSAVLYIKRALHYAPDYVDAYCNLAIVLHEMGCSDEAISYYQEAIKINPNAILAYYNLGNILREKGQIDESITFYTKAIEINSELAEAYHGLGFSYQEKGKLDKAIHYYQKALEINPYLIEGYCNLSNVLGETGQLDEANICIQKALLLDSQSALAHYILGDIMSLQGKVDEALDAYGKAINCDPHFTIARLAKCISRIPMFYGDESSILKARTSYKNELIQLKESVSLKTNQEIEAAAEAVGRQQPFLLAAQPFNNRLLQQEYGNLICRIMEKRYPQFAKRLTMPPYLFGESLRIGIVSGYFCQHSNWKIPIKGWVENLNKERFSLFGYYTRTIKDEETQTARRCFKKFVEDIYSFKQLCQMIQDDKLHILIYPETGMDPTTIRLAALRLAPLQCTSWGHPNTSGLPTIDYFLSSDLMEPSEADEHYTERLIRLPNLSISYAPQDITPIEANRATFGLSPRSVLFLCCQSLFKYLPQYDEIYPRIAQQVSDCQFIFISHKSSWITEQYRLRLCKAFEKNGLNPDKFLVFLPRLSQEQFYALNRLSDVYLDSIDWSGCNTTLEAIACNLPVVTRPGKLMRGRHSAAILNMMGLGEIIADSLDSYIMFAVKLGQDTLFKQYISSRIASNKHRVYNDMTCISAFEECLESMVKERQ
jgi:protein O-GlcNAc transferase